MIRPVRGWLDSDGNLHADRAEACKAEFRKLLSERFRPRLIEGDEPALVIPVGELVDAIFELDKMIGHATKEDTRADLSL